MCTLDTMENTITCPLENIISDPLLPSKDVETFSSSSFSRRNNNLSSSYSPSSFTTPPHHHFHHHNNNSSLGLSPCACRAAQSTCRHSYSPCHCQHHHHQHHHQQTQPTSSKSHAQYACLNFSYCSNPNCIRACSCNSLLYTSHTVPTTSELNQTSLLLLPPPHPPNLPKLTSFGAGAGPGLSHRKSRSSSNHLRHKMNLSSSSSSSFDTLPPLGPLYGSTSDSLAGSTKSELVAYYLLRPPFFKALSPCPFLSGFSAFAIAGNL